MRHILPAIALVGLLTAPSFATQCRNAQGKFVKCEKAAPAKTAPCRDAKGKYIKCPK